MRRVLMCNSRKLARHVFLQRLGSAFRRLRAPLYNAVTNYFLQSGLIDLNFLKSFELAPHYSYQLEKVVSDSVVKRSPETAESRTKSLEEHMTSMFSFSLNGFIEKRRITNDGGVQRVKVVTLQLSQPSPRQDLELFSTSSLLFPF